MGSGAFVSVVKSDVDLFNWAKLRFRRQKLRDLRKERGHLWDVEENLRSIPVSKIYAALSFQDNLGCV